MRFQYRLTDGSETHIQGQGMATYDADQQQFEATLFSDTCVYVMQVELLDQRPSADVHGHKRT